MELARRATVDAAGDQSAIARYRDSDTEATTCQVCYEDFSCPLPLPDLDSRAAHGGFLCPATPGHAFCRRCDAELRARGLGCPMCRAQLRQYHPP